MSVLSGLLLTTTHTPHPLPPHPFAKTDNAPLVLFFAPLLFLSHGGFYLPFFLFHSFSFSFFSSGDNLSLFMEKAMMITSVEVCELATYIHSIKHCTSQFDLYKKLWCKNYTSCSGLVLSGLSNKLHVEDES